MKNPVPPGSDAPRLPRPVKVAHVKQPRVKATYGRMAVRASASTVNEDTIDAICKALRLGSSKRKACAKAGVDYEMFMHDWMVKPGEPYLTLRRRVIRAQADFEERHLINLTIASRKQPNLSTWLLSHSPSTRADWREYQSPLIGGPGSTLNLAVVLDKVHERRKQRMLPPAPDASANGHVVDPDPSE